MYVDSTGVAFVKSDVASANSVVWHWDYMQPKESETLINIDHHAFSQKVSLLSLKHHD